MLLLLDLYVWRFGNVITAATDFAEDKSTNWRCRLPYHIRIISVHPRRKLKQQQKKFVWGTHGLRSSPASSSRSPFLPSSGSRRASFISPHSDSPRCRLARWLPVVAAHEAFRSPPAAFGEPAARRVAGWWSESYSGFQELMEPVSQNGDRDGHHKIREASLARLWSILQFCCSLLFFSIIGGCFHLSKCEWKDWMKERNTFCWWT